MTIYRKPLSPMLREAIPLSIIGKASSTACLAADWSANALPNAVDALLIL